MPWVIALRVVSLPATASRMTKNAKLDVAQGFSVDVGLDQPGDDVVGRASPTLLGHVVGVPHQLGVGRRRVVVEVRVVGVHERVGPVEQLLPVCLRDADQIGDREQRQAHRDVFDEVPRSLLRRGADDAVRGGGEPFLERGDRPGCEERGHQLAQPGVLRCVVIDQQRLRQVQLLGRDAVGLQHHRDLLVGRPQIAVA
jgi:hypothetical protein